MNSSRRNNGLDFLIISQVVHIGHFFLLVVKSKNFIIIFNSETNAFVKDPLYINADINDSIVTLRACQFGDLPGDFIAVSYINFNDLKMMTSAKILVTPLSRLDAHSDYVKILMSTMSQLDHFEINQSFLAGSFFNPKSKSDVLKYTSLQGIAAQSTDLVALGEALGSNMKEQQIDGNITDIDCVKGNLFVGLNNNRFFMLNTVSGESRMFNYEGKIVFVKDLPQDNSQGIRAILLTETGDLSIANIGNTVEKPTWSNLNMPVLRAHVIPFNQGKF